MFRKIIFLSIMLVLLTAKSKKQSYNSSYLTDEIKNDIESLLYFENILNDIENKNEQAEFLKSISYEFYQLTLELESKFEEQNQKIENAILLIEKEFGYKTKTRLINHFRNIQHFKSMDASENYLNKHFAQAKKLRSQLVGLYKWTKLKLKDRKRYLEELNITGPSVIYYIDDNKYLTDYTYPVEISKYLTDVAKNNIDSLYNFLEIGEKIDNSIEKARFYGAISEALATKAKGLEIEFNYTISKMKSIIRYYEREMKYKRYPIKFDPKMEKIKSYVPLAINKVTLKEKLFEKQAHQMLEQHSNIEKFVDENIKKYTRIMKIMEFDYHNRRKKHDNDGYHFLSDYLSNKFRNNRYSLLECELIADNSHISSKYVNDVFWSINVELLDSLEKAIFYRAIAEDYYVKTKNLNKKFKNDNILYSNIINHYERYLGYDQSFTFLGEIPILDSIFVVSPIDLNNVSNTYDTYYNQMVDMSELYSTMENLYNRRNMDYEAYLRILKSDKARALIAKNFTHLKSGDLYYKEIFSSPYYDIIENTEDSLFNYISIAQNIDNQIERNEFYRTISEGFYWSINNRIDAFYLDQIEYRKTISQLERSLGKKLKRIKDKRINLSTSFVPVRILQSTINMDLPKENVQLMEDQYNLISQDIIDYNIKYANYIELLENKINKRESLYNENINSKIRTLSKAEEKSKLINKKFKYYKNQENFYQNIPILDLNNYNSDYIRVTWDIHENLSNMIWYNPKGKEIKVREFIYKNDELIKSIDKQDGERNEITWVSPDPLGKVFFDYVDDIILSESLSYYKEMIYNHNDLIQSIYINEISGNPLGVIEYTYDNNNNIEGVIWYMYNTDEMNNKVKEKVREISLDSNNNSES